MSLAKWQHDFRNWLVNATDDAAHHVGQNPAPGLAVYQNNYRAQLVECLEQSYPQVRTWLGDDTFLHAAVKHINKYPPHAWTLDAYAHDFETTLRTLYPHNPDLHELTWIENALSVAFVAPDAKPLPVDALATVDWDSARLRMAPSLLRRSATTNADSIWTALVEGEAVPEGNMLPEAGGLIVWRRGFTSYLQRVDAIEYEALLQVQQDGSFAALCDRLVARLGDAEGIERAGALLAAWLNRELIADVEDI